MASPPANRARNPRSGRIHRSIGYGNADQMNQRQSQSNCHRAPACWRSFVGRAEDDHQKHKREHNLCDRTGNQGISSRRMRSITIRRKASCRHKTVLTAGDNIQNARARDCAHYPSYYVRSQIRCRESLACRQSRSTETAGLR